MSEIGIEQARKTLGELVDRARLAGEITYITRHGKRAAAIVPVDRVKEDPVGWREISDGGEVYIGAVLPGANARIYRRNRRWHWVVTDPDTGEEIGTGRADTRADAMRAALDAVESIAPQD